MPSNRPSASLAHALSTVSLSVLLAACGGGGGAEVEPSASSTPFTAAPAPTATSHPAASATPASASESDSSGASADAGPFLVDAVAGSSSSQWVGVDETPTATILAVSSNTILRDTTVIPGSATGAIYYADNRIGNDANDGLSPTQIAPGRGPWQSLSRATQALNPGDTLRLACGASWNETLRPARSGTATAAITIASHPAGCNNPAAIDGSTYLGPAAWTQESGSIYRARLSQRPSLVLSDAGVFRIAHHPNRGYDSAKPTSLFFANAADSNLQTVGNVSGSTYLTTGSDFKLPTGAAITPGTLVRVRPNAWTLSEVSVSSVSGTRVNLASPTRGQVKSGWGYYFVGQRWMLDSPGEWFWDAAAGMLFAWLPNSSAPTGFTRAVTRSVGVNLSSLQYITVDGLTVRGVVTGIDARSSRNVVVRNSRIEDTAHHGIDATGSTALTAASNALSRTGGDSIIAGAGTNAQVLNNRINQSGVRIVNGNVVSLPVSAVGAIIGGDFGTITGNTVTDTAYTSIMVHNGSTVTGNSVAGSCATLDDCGGIYTYGPDNNSVITGNLVRDTRGALDGKGSLPLTTQAQGIYLDELATGVLVEGNTVTGADHGIQVHISSNNTIRRNKLYGNRVSQIFMQEGSARGNEAGDLFGNIVDANQVVPTTSTARGFWHLTTVNDTTRFAAYDTNIYFDRLFARVGVEETPAGLVEYTFKAWQAAKTPGGQPRQQDASGRAASAITNASLVIAGSNIVPNGQFPNSLTGWSTYNATAPRGTLTRLACELGFCAHYVAGGSEGLVSSPNFSVTKDRWYRITADVKGSVNGQVLNLVLRRGGGGSNGYEPLSSLYAYVPITTSWSRLTFTVQATKSIQAADPLTGDLGARLDFASIKPGQSLTLGNVEIVPVDIPASSSRTALLINDTASPATVVCPTAGSAPQLCGSFYRLSDNAPVAWPYPLTARSSEIVFTLDTSLIDSDADGIANSQDACAATPAGLAVNAQGCALWQ